MTASALIDRVDRLCTEASSELPASYAADIEAIRQRLREPLRIAIAGRVKAGKSTLLNALIGERLAPTDAGECTRVVTWYRYDAGYSVTALTESGILVFPRFRKGQDALEIEVPAGEALRSIEVGWPSRRLHDAVYIDTPGLGSLTPASGHATRSLLGVEDNQPSQADAVIYLMRHAHSEDVHFLEGFRDAGLPLGSPVNTVAVLSRADEIGGGRLDALDSARRIADRYMSDERIRSLASTIIPMTGLLAETAVTLEEAEFASLRQVAANGGPQSDLLLSVDRFRDADANPLTAELRERVLARFGLFGIRFSVRSIANGTAPTSQALATLLLDISGVNGLRAVIEQKFTSRARALVARSAVSELRALVSRASAEHRAQAPRLSAGLEAILASANELALLQMLHEIAVGIVAFSSDEQAEAERLAGGGDITRRLDLPPGAARSQLEAAILSAVERWRVRGANPLARRDTSRACEVMARAYEGLYSELGSPPA
jgi:hypothetical protein